FGAWCGVLSEPRPPRGLDSGPTRRSSDLEDGLPTAELDVERRRILEGEALLESVVEQVQLEQGGVLEHPEGPLVRIGDEREPGVFQSGRGSASRVVSRLGLDDAASRDSTREEFCRRHGVPRLEASLVEETQDTAVAEDDARGRVAEGPGIGPDHRVQDPSVTCSGSSAEATASSTAFLPVIRDLKARKATAMPASPPRIAWSSRLPDPASRYAKML